MDTILSPLYTAVSWIIVQFHSLFSLVFDEDSGWAWGLSIFCLVVLIRICLIPLFVKQIKSTRNMQALQPKMKAIQERYKSDKQRQSEEMMKLYKETGTNPLSSCLPILAQSPFFIALFQVLNHIANDKAVGVLTGDQVDSARNATIFGAPIAAKFMDSAGDVASLGDASLTTVRIVTVIMIVLMSASQFYTQRQLMTKNVDLTVKTPFMQQQKMLMYVFPIMFAVFGINFPVGVLIYWLTTNVWTMGQQMYVIKRNPTPGSRAFEERQEKLRAKGKLKEDPKEVEAREAAEAARVRRQQPKRQPKAKRQSGGSVATKDDSASAATSLQKTGPKGNQKQGGQSGQKSTGQKGAGQKQGGGSKAAGQAKSGQQQKSGQKKSGQRKGPQRPKHPSKK
ncbi:membrane protein insertase YidC [Streptomyces smyrnaeus]|uniref:Membrane protein insertase YidC n=1 Tax=Streptomyces smyrnaeus TaxID=1387713 RepID=A0ABS3XQ17_9ACTN|nr:MULTISPECIES: membrane protein insertase YidC [Streptomyces]MBO8197493.1 membrane protein insertase YidC [Streptomyces smyrnaeus]MBQ0864412.1 membrane protein insertase YidC [Streptomyces sp. RK75]MBQ1118752.1 membrane protein insertase YidC [Streptomyces sp. B15]MBQ1159836.1 membrane protein insertase YidC [Streptomyces sp. A73]